MNSLPALLAHGVLIADELAASVSCAALWQEARAAWPRARRCAVQRSSAHPWRGGEPARRFAQANGGAAQAAFASAPGVLRALAYACGVPLRPSGVGTYSYYEGAGDFLDLHRDVVGCEVTLLTCLFVRGGGGTLWAWPERRHEPIPRIAASASRGAVPVTLRPGQSAILLGGAVPHCLAPLAHGQARVVSVLCYEPAAAVTAPASPFRAAAPANSSRADAAANAFSPAATRSHPRDRQCACAGCRSAR